MDAARFDTLVRSLSEGMTRRGLTRLLGGLTLGGLLDGLLRPLSSEAKKPGHRKGKGKSKSKGKGKRGRKDHKGHDGKEKARATSAGCRPAGASCSRNSQCCSAVCSQTINGICVCPSGSQDCDGDGSCEQLGTNQHCTGCNTPCTGGQICQGGQCVTPTPPCSTDTDCPSGQVCQSGTCGTPAPQCVNDWDCPYLHICRSGQCGCPAGWQDCGTTCADTQTNWARCGSCDHACGYAQDCVNGQCVCNIHACLIGSTCVYNTSNVACGPSCTDCTAIPFPNDEEPWTCQRGECVRCGDGVCNGCETCRTCPADCGECPLCTADDECTAAGWCHPTTCDHVDAVPICGGACDTGGCTFGEIGCDAYCACQSGQCVAVPIDWGF